MSIDTDGVFLAQGTLRPDLIEGASTGVTEHADVIKTHHNDSPMARVYRNEFLKILIRMTTFSEFQIYYPDICILKIFGKNYFNLIPSRNQLTNFSHFKSEDLWTGTTKGVILQLFRFSKEFTAVK